MPDFHERAAEAFKRRRWGDVLVTLRAADETELAADDFERLAVAADLAGKSEESDEAWAKAHSKSLAEQDARRSARAAFWLGMSLMDRGEGARGGAWFARAAAVLEGED